ncbi:MAG: DUF2063 domain-containing protein [Burkholderiales bacterium]|nr:MAG: DUF2063 domain-containing protein [Burkholderiales bacterium]
MSRSTAADHARTLARFQDAFTRALFVDAADPTDDATIAPLRSQLGFAVYRNTVIKGCIDALLANYPAVARLVGDEWMRAAAAFHARHAPPSQPCLVDYGEGFAGFLAGFPPAAGLPYLPDVAWLDRLWTEAHLAADEPPLEAARVASLTEAELANAVLTPHASARWAWFDRHPALSIWRHSRAGAAGPADDGAAFEPAWQAEGALLVRTGDAVVSMALDRAECAFLDACAGMKRLGECAAAALAADPAADLAASMARLLRAGAFTRLHVPCPPPEELPT